MNELDNLWKRSKDAFDKGGYKALPPYVIATLEYDINFETAKALDECYFGVSGTMYWRETFKYLPCGGLLTW